MHAAKVTNSPRLQRVLDRLRQKNRLDAMTNGDGFETTRGLRDHADICAVNSCIAELRANGYIIETRCTGRGRYEYKLHE